MEEEREEKGRREQESDDNVGFPALWHSRNRDNDRGRGGEGTSEGMEEC